MLVLLHAACGIPLQDTIVVTYQRALFLWRRWFFGLSLVSLEESFYLDDLQVIFGPAHISAVKLAAIGLEFYHGTLPLQSSAQQAMCNGSNLDAAVTAR
jgi:hypothetical protein